MLYLGLELNKSNFPSTSSIEKLNKTWQQEKGGIWSKLYLLLFSFTNATYYQRCPSEEPQFKEK